MDNYLIAEQLIVDRLRSRLNSGVKVLSAVDLAGVSETAQVTPAVHVVYQGYRTTQATANGRKVETEQTWLAVVAVRNVRDTRAGTAAREDAGPILLGCMKALCGWKPHKELDPLALAGAPAPGFSAGFGYFPLAFTTRIVTEGDAE